MTNKKVLALGLLVSLGLANATLADSGHGHVKKTDAGAAPSTPKLEKQGVHSQTGMMGGDHHAMMRSMMKMHMAGMVGGGMEQTGMSMRDRDMMSMMIPRNGGQSISEAMGAKIEEFDTDKDGALTLAEFEGLHMAAQRESMVDRFQHLDSDGDGQITRSELDMAATRMNAIKENAGGMGMDGQLNDDK
jgi:hypothetical protein